MVGDWISIDVSSAEVYSSEAEITVNGKSYKLKRQEYHGWAMPCYYLDMQEPVLNLKSYSLIENLNRKLSKIEGYKLIDYGIVVDLE